MNIIPKEKNALSDLVFDSKKRILILTKPYLYLKKQSCLYRKTVLLEKTEDGTFGFELQVRGFT